MPAIKSADHFAEPRAAVTLAIKSVVVAIALAMVSSASQAQILLPYQHKKRPLIVFAPSEQHPGLMRQKNAINGARTAISDRDVVVLYIVGAALSVDFGGKPGVSAQSLRSLYRTSEGAFRVLLLDKEGRTRLDTAAPLSATDILSEIDRVPTRRDSVRQRTQ